MRNSYGEAKRSSGNNDRAHVSPRLSHEDGSRISRDPSFLRSSIVYRLSSIVDRRDSNDRDEARRTRWDVFEYIQIKLRDSLSYPISTTIVSRTFRRSRVSTMNTRDRPDIPTYVSTINRLDRIEQAHIFSRFSSIYVKPNGQKISRLPHITRVYA